MNESLIVAVLKLVEQSQRIVSTGERADLNGETRTRQRVRRRIGSGADNHGTNAFNGLTDLVQGSLGIATLEIRPGANPMQFRRPPNNDIDLGDMAQASQLIDQFFGVLAIAKTSHLNLEAFHITSLGRVGSGRLDRSFGFLLGW